MLGHHASEVRDNRGGTREERLRTGGGGLGDQHLTWLDLGECLWASGQAWRPRPGLLGLLLTARLVETCPVNGPGRQGERV